jgi:hypothetical protein
MRQVGFAGVLVLATAWLCVAITGLTLTQAAPASTGTAIFNLIDATKAFDFQ